MANPTGIRHKNPVGRPLKFKTPEELEKKCKEYFDITPTEEVTITGLALHLDTDRITLMQYEKRDEFTNTVKRAKLAVEHAYEMDLRAKGRAGDIFALKNFNWTDKQEIDMNANVTTSDLLADMDDPE